MAAYNAISNKPFAQSVHPKYHGSGLPEKLFEVSTALTLAPDHGTYFNMALPANEILIKSLTVKTSAPEANSHIMLFNREQKTPDPDMYDICYQDTVQNQRVVHLFPEQPYYRDEDGKSHLHGGIFLHQRPMRFDLVGQDLDSYLEKTATLEISARFSIIADTADGDGATLLTRDVIEDYLKIKRHQRLKDDSLKTYQKHLAHFEKLHPVLPIDEDSIVEYLSLFKGDSGRTRLNRQSELAQLYAFASRKFGIHNPVSGLPRPQITRRPIRTMTLDEIARLYQAAASERERAALDLLLGHGWRQIEVRRITAGDVRNIRNGMIWVHGKEREEYTPVLPETAQRLMDMAEGLEESDHVFQGRTRELGESGMAKMINTLLSIAGLTEYRGHDLRRTFATVVREHSKDEFLAMRLLRDQVPILNSRYVTISESTLREALELYSPIRLVGKDSPAILGEKSPKLAGELPKLAGELPKLAGELPKLAGEITLETGEIMVETGESRTPRPEEATQNILQA